MNRIYVLIFLLFLTGVFVAVGGARSAMAPKLVRFEGETMGTAWHVSVVETWKNPISEEQEKEIQAALEEALKEVDFRMSTWKEFTELSRINAEPSIETDLELSPELAFVLAKALEISRKTNGAYDVTVGPLVNLWKFGPTRENPEMPEIPSDEAIAEAKVQIGWDSLELVSDSSAPLNSDKLENPNLSADSPTSVDSNGSAESNGSADSNDSAKSNAESQSQNSVSAPKSEAEKTVSSVLLRRKKEGLSIDLSSIAKGYGVDRAVSALEKFGFADFMVEVGGEVRTRGRNHHEKPWRIGIELPVPDSNQIYCAVSFSDQALATSGDYRNFKLEGDLRRSHIIDPRTGKPVEHSLVSVSVLADDCMTADGWATALMVLGPEEGKKIAEQEKLQVLFLIQDGQKIRSENVHFPIQPNPHLKQ